MNKSKHPMTAKLRKKMNKELKTATRKPEPVLRTDVITPQELLSRIPPKARKKEASLQKSFEKTIITKKKKQKAHTSKRTTPGSIEEKSSPQIVHVEGKRWIKTLAKQNLTKRKILIKRLAKKGSK